jgi:hypothetical protein
MKYIKDLEAVGFERSQAEAQVQMVMEAIEGDLVTKFEFGIFQERVENRFNQVDYRFTLLDRRFDLIEQKFEKRLAEIELRMTARLGILTVSTVSVATAILSWLMKAS